MLPSAAGACDELVPDDPEDDALAPPDGGVTVGDEVHPASANMAPVSRHRYGLNDRIPMMSPKPHDSPVPTGGSLQGETYE